MKVYVRLFGFLSQQFPEYDSNIGLTVDLPGGSSVKDLLKHLNIDTSGDSVVSNGRVLKAQDRLSARCYIEVFPVVHGG